MAFHLFSHLKSLCPRTVTSLTCQFNVNRLSTIRKINTPARNATFGFMFDVDGVLVRGKKVIPEAITAFRKLVDHNDQFKVPVVFVTNAGNHLRCQKAEKLSETLGVKITEDQVIMCHSPLKMLKEFHDKRVLVSGQGPIREISQNLGFTNICTVEDIQEAFPVLDVVDHRKLEKLSLLPRKADENFAPIEAIVLMQEPVEWDSALQLIIDVLMTNGRLLTPPSQPPYPHIPLIACNFDLQWMSEAWMPRFGHGAFLICLEELYKKLTSKELVYTEIIGKPSLLTMRHADNMAQLHAQTLGFDGVRTIYFVGDNLNTDIFGANLYHRYLTQQSVELTSNGTGSRLVIEHNISNFAMECHSILVETGVHSASSVLDQNHTPRDFIGLKGNLKKPSFVAPDVLQAVELAFKRENFN